MIQILSMAFRDLGRNRRRSFFSALAVSMGLAMLMLLAGLMEKWVGRWILPCGSKADTSRCEHKIIRNKTSLKWEDLVENPDQVARRLPRCHK